MRHFIDCLLKDQEPVCTGRHGLEDLVLLEAAYRSAQSGQPVGL